MLVRDCCVCCCCAILVCAHISFFLARPFSTRCKYSRQGTLQNFCRRTRNEIDGVTYEFEPLAASGTPYARPEQGMIVHGLFLEGAAWSDDAMALVDSQPRVLLTPMASIWLRPKVENKEENDEGADMTSVARAPVYSMPLYNTSCRFGTLSTTGHSTNFIKYLTISAGSHDAAYWTKRGAAAFLQESD